MSTNLTAFREYISPITDIEFLYVIDHIPGLQLDNFTMNDINDAILILSDYRYSRDYDGLENLNLNTISDSVYSPSLNKKFTSRRFVNDLPTNLPSYQPNIITNKNNQSTLNPIISTDLLTDRFNSSLSISNSQYNPIETRDIWTL